MRGGDSDRAEKRFWCWFVDNQAAIEASYVEQDQLRLASIMEDGLRLLQLPFGWEIGPGDTRDYNLTISLNGRPELLEPANHLAAACPPLEHWEITVGRRRKASHEVRFTNRQGQVLELSTRDWRYVLLKYDDSELLDIELMTPLPCEVDDGTWERIAFTCLQNHLGEVLLLQSIGTIYRQENCAESWMISSSAFAYLIDHLQDLGLSGRISC